MEKIWFDIPEYEGIYMINKEGDIKRILKYRKGRPYNESPIKHRIDKDGYLKVTLYNKKPKNYFVHRLLAKTFINNPLNKPCINHKNGIKNDNRLDNLEWVTILENNLHAINNGFKKPLKGEKHNFVKINISQVYMIRDEWATGLFKQHEIALKHGLKQSQISRIVNYKRWS